MTILTALSVLSGAAAPAVSDYVEEAKLVRARSDVRTIGVTLVRLFNDVGGERDLDGGWGRYDLLVGAGAVPTAGGDGSRGWTPLPSDDRVGMLDAHLIANGPGYTVRRGVRPGWRGAYLQDPVSADPWGNRYAVNVAALRSAHLDTIVVSAGRDGIIESAFEHDGLPTTGDDIASLVSSTGR